MTTPQNNNDKPEFKGFIISYNSENGYGFVRGEDGEDFYFKIRAFKENELPQISRQVIFTLNDASAKKGQNPSISWLKYDTTATNKNEKHPANKDDSRIQCPHCGKKIMPRMVIMNGAPYASHCPICGGKVRQFQKISFVPFVIIIGIIVLFFLSISFLRVFF